MQGLSTIPSLDGLVSTKRKILTVFEIMSLIVVIISSILMSNNTKQLQDIAEASEVVSLTYITLQQNIGNSGFVPPENVSFTLEINAMQSLRSKSLDSACSKHIGEVISDLNKDQQMIKSSEHLNSEQITSIHEKYGQHYHILFNELKTYRLNTYHNVKILEVIASLSITVLILTLFLHAIMTLLVLVRNNDLRLKAFIDDHTHLPNKNKCEDIFEKNKTPKHPYSICVFDLNNLKTINDTHGHMIGDVCIQHFASALRKTVPNDYFVGRFGGDEFIVMCEDMTDTVTLQRMIDDIIKHIDEINDKSSDIKISFAYGYATTEEFEGLPLEEVFLEADKRMYLNKQLSKQGRQN